MRNKYNILDEQGFDAESLHPGEIGVEVVKLSERDNKGDPIIELKLQIFWAADEYNQQYIGQEFKYPIFFGAKNDQTTRILKDVFKRAKFQVGTWNSDGLPLSIAIPGAIKLLAWKHVPVIGKVVTTTRDGSSRNFFNFTKIIRENPETGEVYADALPDPVLNSLVQEAFNAVLDGDSAESLM
jgi:hypothetical protein